MAILFDVQCANGHVSEQWVPTGADCVDCPNCGSPARKVYLTAPRLDWYGMAVQKHAGPEFEARFAKMHERETRRQEKILKEHGDYGPGYDPPPDLTPQ